MLKMLVLLCPKHYLEKQEPKNLIKKKYSGECLKKYYSENTPLKALSLILNTFV